MQPGDVGAEAPALAGLVMAAKRKPAPVEMTVLAGVERDLADIAARDEKLAQSGLATQALALAKELDNPNSATSKSMCARALLETLDRLLELAPVEEKLDDIDEIAAQRARRQAAAAA